MSKRSWLGGGLFMVALLAGCGDNGDSSASTDTTAASTTSSSEPASTTPPTSETASSDASTSSSPDAPADPAASLVITADGVGGLTRDTPYDVAAVGLALPGYDAAEGERSSEGIAYPVIEVSRGGELVMTVEGTEDGTTIDRIWIEKHDNNDGLGFPIGAATTDIFPDGAPTDCLPGVEENSGSAFCPAPSAPNLAYVLDGEWDGPDGTIPPADVLNTWQLRTMYWRANVN